MLQHVCQKWMTSPRPLCFLKTTLNERSGAARTTESIKVMHKSESGSKSRFSPQRSTLREHLCTPHGFLLQAEENGNAHGRHWFCFCWQHPLPSTELPTAAMRHYSCRVVQKATVCLWTVLRALAVKILTLLIVTMILLLLNITVVHMLYAVLCWQIFTSFWYFTLIKKFIVTVKCSLVEHGALFCTSHLFFIGTLKSF